MRDERHIEISQAPQIAADLEAAWSRVEALISQSISAIQRGMTVAEWRAENEYIVVVQTRPMSKDPDFVRLRTSLERFYLRVKALTDDVRTRLSAIERWVEEHPPLETPPANAESDLVYASQVVSILHQAEDILADLPSIIEQISRLSVGAKYEAKRARDLYEAAMAVPRALGMLGEASGRVVSETVTRTAAGLLRGAGWLILLILGIYLLTR